jgi:hypothetical protein
MSKFLTHETNTRLLRRRETTTTEATETSTPWRPEPLAFLLFCLQDAQKTN